MSDSDVVVVINDNSDSIDIAVKIRFMKKASIPLSIIVLKRNELSDPIYLEIFKYSKKIC